MVKDCQQLSWAQSIFMVLLDCLLALAVYFTVWGMFGIAYLVGIKDTYAEWSWYKYSMFLMLWAVFSIYIDIRMMNKKPVDGARK